ncbi:MAG: alanine--tRNA ligase [Nitrososphaerales archaeon]|nr:alanine--tRNA ligase [Nitrososphaerales archaeon]
MNEKDRLRLKFSSDPEKYYQVELFIKEGFIRRQCPKCGKYYWTLNPDQDTCPDQPCQPYTFIDDPPTNKRFNYIEAWKQIEEFFVKNGHTSVKRYPVVCRWRPDLYFTVASIIAFQRVEGGKIVFELPYNPLIIPQMCLRFNDIPNVGVSGKHYTSFCMVGQHSISNEQGYWKDRCIELDYELLKGPFGIPPEEISFLEDVWLGYGAFGYSLEYFVRGLELGNAVFTAFEGTPQDYREMKEKVIDMGAGLERFTWITQGTPTSYDAVFGPIIQKMIDRCGIEYDRDFHLKYVKILSNFNLGDISDTQTAKLSVAERLGISLSELEKRVSPLEALYAIADHIRSLVFAITDGLLPSNVGGGYNLRVILRRALGLIDKFGWDLKLEEVADWHISYLKEMYPELEEHRDEVFQILQVEEKRYRNAKERMKKVLFNIMRSKKSLSEEDLIKLYDSEGITPELLKESGLQVTIPPDFYTKVTERHLLPKPIEEQMKFDVDDLPPTTLLFYKDPNLFEFQARVLKVFQKRFVVLDQTAFYATAGGQEYDTGFINGCKVLSVKKYGTVVIHEVDGCELSEGQLVDCKVDEYRRGILMRHHTATHIVNGAARQILGSWVWQHSAHKDVDRSKLDITHYSHLSRDEILKIESLANEIVRKNIPIEIELLPRGVAEQRYGFRIYQGGVVPSRDVRIVKIGDFDIEACGGTHCFRTGDVGFIKILKSERIQDGIERIEFVAGEPAVSLAQNQENLLLNISKLLNTSQDKVLETIGKLKSQHEGLKRRWKILINKISPDLAQKIINESVDVDGLKVYTTSDEVFDEESHISIGEKVINLEPKLIYCSFIPTDDVVKLLVFCGNEAQKRGIKANLLVKEAAKFIGGSGGGDERFAQGGGIFKDKVEDAIKTIPSIIKGMLG